MFDQTADPKITTANDTDTNTDRDHTRLIPDLTSILECDKIATKHACTFHPVSGYLDTGGELNADWKYKIVYIHNTNEDPTGDTSQGINQIKIRTGILSPRTPRAYQLAHEGKIHRLVSNGVDPNIAKASLQVKYGQEFDVCYLANRILHHSDLPFVWTYLSERMIRDNRLYTRACLAYLRIDIGGMSDLRCLSAIEIAFNAFIQGAGKEVSDYYKSTREVINHGRRIADRIGK